MSRWGGRSWHAVQFRFCFAHHEFGDEFSWSGSVVQDPPDERRQGHLEPMLISDFEHRGGGLDAFGHHVHFVDDVVEGPTATELDADVTIPALGAGAGCDEVTHARESGEGEGLTAEGDAEAGELREATRDQ